MIKQLKLSTVELKPGHNLPINLSGRCSVCYPVLVGLQRKGLIPSSQDLQTIFINRSNNQFGYRCINSKCQERAKFETLKCFLRHRDFKLVDMTVALSGEVWVDVDTNEINLDDPHMDEYISLHYGPMKDCKGVLDWDNNRNLDGSEWLKCTECDAKYRAFVFGYYSNLTNSLTREHTEYELLPQAENVPWKVHKKEAWIDAKGAMPVPLDWTAAITEVRYNGSTMFTLTKY